MVGACGVMAGTLRERRGLVLYVWELPGRDAGAAEQPARRELARRAARERAEVAVQMGLVVVAAVERELGEAVVALAAQPPGHPLEAHQPGHCLRRQSQLGTEARAEVAAAPSQLAGERIHAGAATAR